MSTIEKATLIFAIALLCAVGIVVYFSPYHSCSRAWTAAKYSPAYSARTCIGGPLAYIGVPSSTVHLQT